MLKTIATTVHEDFHKEFKGYCAYNDLVMSEVLTELIRNFLKSEKSRAKR